MVERQENEALLDIIYKELFLKKGKVGDIEKVNGIVTSIIDVQGKFYIGHTPLFFRDKESYLECEQIYNHFVDISHNDIFLEEPEANLFPPTQTVLVEWLTDLTKEEKPSNLFIATHSPYILETFLEKKNIGVQLFYTRKDGDQMLIKTATEQDLQDMYDYGLDAFFNMESLG